jgi:DNA-binding CsgD family transcriptional regulator/tetratricopeptide (TPR) repeat protein
MQLLERESYIEELSAMLGRVPCVGGRVALISGEAGIGKTSLLREFAAAQNKAARVLWGGCEALFTPHPLAPLQDISRQIGGDFPRTICAASGRHEIFNATLDQFARLSGPTVVIIEDAHWADAATLDLIKFLGRRLAGLGVLLVVSYRDDEVNDKHPLRSVIGDLPPAALCRIRLQPLSEGAVGQLAAAVGRSSTGLHEVTGGNPFFVTEVLAASEEKVPSTVRDAVIARLARLSEEARRVAHLVSIVPRHAERWLIDGMIGPGGEVLQECLNAGMVAHRDCSLGFRHEIARRAVEDSMSLPERQDLHAGVLAMLLKQSEGKVAIGRLVHHADNAADSAAVVRFAPVAAERAAALGAHRDAAGHLRTALRHAALLGTSFAEEERALLFERLSYECYLTDEMADASAAREMALAVWRSLGSRRKEGDALRWLSRLSWFNGRKAAAEAYANEAVTVLEQQPPGRELAMAYSNSAQLHMLAENVVASLEWGRKALELAIRLGETEIEVHALTNIGTAKLVAEDPAGRDDLERALATALKGGFEEHAARAFTNLGTMSFRHREFAAAIEYLKAGIAYCDEHNLDSWIRYMTAYRAQIKMAVGRWDDAVKDAQTVIRHPRVAPVSKIPALATLGRIRARRGDPDPETPLGETPLAEGYRLAVPTAEMQRLVQVLAARAEAAWLRGGDAPDVLADLSKAYELGLKHADSWIQGELAFWLWRHGRLDHVPARVARPFALQMAGDWQAAARAWQEIGSPYEQAMALADSDAEGPLRTALEIFERLDAGPMAAIVRRKLRASGVRSIPRGAQERTRQNPCGMTNRQLRVLGLLVEGRRNADIARRLFVAEKTVDHHVSAVLAKLGVRSRGEAVAAATRLGLCELQIEELVAKK